jgi:two-component system sensor histidine kinase MprB
MTMTMRARIAATAGVSVALAVLAAALGLYLGVRSDLRGEVDKSLRERAHAFVAPAPAAAPSRGGAQGSAGIGQGGAQGSAGPGQGGAQGGAGPRQGGAQGSAGLGPPPGDGDGDGGAGGAPAGGGFPANLPPAPFGAAQGYVQFISPLGALVVPGGQRSPARIAPSAADNLIAHYGSGSSLDDRTVGGTRLRVLTLGTGARGAVMVARPLTEVNHELRTLLLLLALIGVAGIALAVLLGALVARTALAPIARFTARTETLSGSLDLSQRLEVRGRDELARLAQSFNATLDALERSVEAQRHLIADAGHELRTPIASLRANIQVLQEAQRLPPHDLEGLRQDVLAELDELTALVGDVVELARAGDGAGSQAVPLDDVRLDHIVEHALTRARRRGDVRFQAELQPTLLRGNAQRIDRAVSNLLDNARKFSPAHALVEVTLADGELSVRDHGPGFAESDLPFVFDRFYRSDAARAQAGSGLGLAIVRQSALAGGGYAKAANAPGGGALLRVSFGPPVSYTAPTQAKGLA